MAKDSDNQNWYALHFCGGEGTRLWPLSRLDYPKCLLKHPDHSRSLLQEAVGRLQGVVRDDHVRFVTNDVAEEAIRGELQDPGLAFDLEDAQLLRVDSKLKTAAVLVAALMHLTAENPEALLLVSYTDDLIPDADHEKMRYREAIRVAFEYAEQAEEWHAVYVGVPALYPDPDYGYLQPSELRCDRFRGYDVRPAKLVEKPTREEAQRYVEKGWLWNPTVVVRAGALLHLCQELYPQLDTHSDAADRPVDVKPLEEIVRDMREIPALAEHSAEEAIFTDPSPRLCVLAADFAWRDVGTWGKLRGACRPDGQGNVYLVSDPGLVRASNVANCMVVAPDEKLVVVEGLTDRLVIDTGDVLAICPHSAEQLKAAREALVCAADPRLRRYLSATGAYATPSILTGASGRGAS